jgi:hypothetical protein
MTSTVTAVSSLIDTSFPVPGADNDTSGFRNNFGNIQTALARAAFEISDLQVINSALISLASAPPQDPTGFVGGVGGIAGQIYATTSTLYFCTQSYDPASTSTHIWAKITCTPW